MPPNSRRDELLRRFRSLVDEWMRDRSENNPDRAVRDLAVLAVRDTEEGAAIWEELQTMGTTEKGMTSLETITKSLTGEAPDGATLREVCAKARERLVADEMKREPLLSRPQATKRVLRSELGSLLYSVERNPVAGQRVEKAVNSIERFWPGLLESLAKRFEDAETPARKELREKSEALQKARPEWSEAKARLEVYRRNPDLVEAIGAEG